MNRIGRVLLAAVLAAAVAPASPGSPAASAAVDPVLDAAGAAAVSPLGDPMPPDSSVMPPAARPTAPEASLSWIGTLSIPALYLRQRVYNWGCGSSVVPNVVVRWGCTASRNQFLAGHAYGVFRSYYLAYRYHRLRAGMVAYFTDRRGHTTRYRLSWVRLVHANYVWKGLTGAQWAWNNTSTPALTLQTCWGSTNAYRIIARFVRG